MCSSFCSFLDTQICGWSRFSCRLMMVVLAPRVLVFIVAYAVIRKERRDIWYFRSSAFMHRCRRAMFALFVIFVLVVKDETDELSSTSPIPDTIDDEANVLVVFRIANSRFHPLTLQPFDLSKLTQTVTQRFVLPPSGTRKANALDQCYPCNYHHPISNHPLSH